MTTKTLTVNGAAYRRPDHPIVVVCIDGGDPAYLEHGVAAGIIPNMERYMGDVAVLGDARTVIGARETDHDLSGLKGHRLRTHGSLHEADVPILLSRPVSDEYARRAEDRRLHSYEVFDYALNGIPAGRNGMNA